MLTGSARCCGHRESKFVGVLIHQTAHELTAAYCARAGEHNDARGGTCRNSTLAKADCGNCVALLQRCNQKR